MTTFAVFAVVVAHAAAQFVVQAYLTYLFAAHIWQLPEQLRWCLIGALDLFAVVTMTLTYLLRTASRRVRAGSWAAFAFAVGAQCYVAEMVAGHQGWPDSARAMAAFPSVALAVSLELLNLYRLHRARAAAVWVPVAPAPAPPVDAPAASPAPSVTPTDQPARKPGRGQTSRRADDVLVAECRRQVGAGKSTAEVAASLKRTQRWVQLHTKDLRPPRTVSNDTGEISPREISRVGASSPKANGVDLVKFHGGISGKLPRSDA